MTPKQSMIEKQGFINWLLWVKKTAPALYALFKLKYPAIIETLNDSRLGFDIDWGAIGDTAVKFVNAALPVYAQAQQFKQQLQLAKIQAAAPPGYQVPVSTQQYKEVAVPTTTPTTTSQPVTTTSGKQVLEIRIDKGQVSAVASETKKAIGDISRYIPYIGLGIGLFALLTRK